jgi:hypothetical protein
MSRHCLPALCASPCVSAVFWRLTPSRALDPREWGQGLSCDTACDRGGKKRGRSAWGGGLKKPQATGGGQQRPTPELAWLAARLGSLQKSENLTRFFIVSPAQKCVNSAPIQGVTPGRRGRPSPLRSTAYRARHADTTDTAGIGFLLYRLGAGIRENSRHFDHSGDRVGPWAHHHPLVMGGRGWKCMLRYLVVICSRLR